MIPEIAMARVQPAATDVEIKRVVEDAPESIPHHECRRHDDVMFEQHIDQRVLFRLRARPPCGFAAGEMLDVVDSRACRVLGADMAEVGNGELSMSARLVNA